MQERSFTREAVLQALLDAKYDAHYAGTAVDAAWLDPPRLTGEGSPVAASPVSDDDHAIAAEPSRQQIRPLSAQLAELPNSLETSDRSVDMLFVIASPRVVLFGNLLSEEECDLLVSLSRDKLQRSSVVNAATGAYDIHPHRTSLGTYFNRGDNALLQRIEKRIAELDFKLKDPSLFKFS